jgi:hypothetical protein
MTLPTGRCFISYRSTRHEEVGRLARALNVRGVPIWQDRKNLGHQPTEDTLRSAISSAQVSSAILWITPDVSSSPTIKDVEIPLIVKRHQKDSSFGVIPVASGGLGYDQLSSVVGASAGTQRFEDWNVFVVRNAPAIQSEIDAVADKALTTRLKAIHEALPLDAPIEIIINTRKIPAFDPKVALILDWTEYFQAGVATAGVWDQVLLPALQSIASAIETQAPGRRVVASGFSSLSVTTALGTVFLDTRGIPISWKQVMAGGQGVQEWSLATESEESGFVIRTHSRSIKASDLGVMVCVTNDVEQAVAATPRFSEQFRAIVKLEKDDGATHLLSSAGHARDIAIKLQKAIKEARVSYPGLKQIHLFMAAPAGLTVLLGQLLNTFGPIMTYEFVSDGSAQGEYVPALTLNPSSRN